jgi:hypothetical protein
MLNRNSLSGQVTVTSPININYVDLSYNHLEGTISPFLSGAQSLFLNNNNFVGAVPEVSCKSCSIITFLSAPSSRNRGFFVLVWLYFCESFGWCPLVSPPESILLTNNITL